MSIEKLIEMPYHIMDILPMKVPECAGGCYFKVEEYFLKRMAILSRKYIGVLLKLYCYHDIKLSHDGDNWIGNPEPDNVVRFVEECLSDAPSESCMYVAIEDGPTLLTFDKDSTCMTIYNASDELLALLKALASSEGLFVWKP